MNSTPNYQFEKELNINICALDGVDRELKRLEDRVDTTGSALSDRYTKEEVDCKISSKADRCAFEKHLMGPDAHAELFDGKVDKQEGCRLFCEGDQQRLDDLEERQDGLEEELEGKANKTKTEEYNLQYYSGYETANAPSVYWKNEFDEVTISFRVKKSDGSLISGGEYVALLPEGFRPRHITSAPAVYGIEANAQIFLGHSQVNPNGELYVSSSAGSATAIYGQITYLAEQ